MLDRQEAIRSRTPAGVRQELWGIALAYNLVRLEMERAADEAGVEPNRISFVNALALIRNAWLAWSTPPLAPGRIPEGLLICAAASSFSSCRPVAQSAPTLAP